MLHVGGVYESGLENCSRVLGLKLEGQGQKGAKVDGLLVTVSSVAVEVVEIENNSVLK